MDKNYQRLVNLYYFSYQQKPALPNLDYMHRQSITGHAALVSALTNGIGMAAALETNFQHSRHV
jgi:hypothetical protein